MAKGFKDDNGKFRPTEKKNGVSKKDVEPDPKDKKPNVSAGGADDIKKKKAITENAEEHDLEESVLKKLQELEGEDVFIEDSDEESPFGHGKLIKLDNGAEYILFENDDDLRKEAEDQVEQDLENEPEIFEKDFIDSHSEISDTDARLFGVDAGDIAIDGRDLDELVEMAEREGVDFENPDDKEEDLRNELALEYDKLKEGGKKPELNKDDWIDQEIDEPFEKFKEELESKLQDEVSSEIADEVEERIKRNGLRSYIVDDEGLASDEEFMDQYGKWLHLNIEEAVEDAVSSDGAEHFISRIDGDSHEVDGGGVLVKEND